MRLPRFTTRRLMVLVAVVGLALGLQVTIRSRREGFEQSMGFHLNEMRKYKSFECEPCDAAVVFNPPHPSPSRRPWYLYHCRMSEKYYWASVSPWLPVPSDPPPPE